MFDKRDAGTEPPGEARIYEPTDKFLTIRVVGERLNLSRTTIWRLMNQHGLRFVRIGGTRRIRESDLEGWLERHSVSLKGGTNGNTEG